MSFLDDILAPLFEVKVDALLFNSDRLKREGPAFRDNGATVHQTWQGLVPFYKAPEAPTLFAATEPIATYAAAYADDVTVVADAVRVFADEVTKLQEEAKKLQAEAAEVEELSSSPMGRGLGPGGQGVDPSGPQRDLLRSAAAALMVKFQEAEVTCANAIRAVSGATSLTANNGDGVREANEYGQTQDELVGPKSWEQSIPWGVGQAAVNTVGGFWDLLFDGGKTLDGLGIFAASIVGAGLGLDLPGLPKETAQQVLSNVVKGTLAWDEWARNPSNALGQTLFNVGSFLLPIRLGAAAKIAADTAGLGLNGIVYDKANPSGGQAFDPMTGFGARPPTLGGPAVDGPVRTPTNIPEWDKATPAERDLIRSQVDDIRGQVRDKLDQYADDAWNYVDKNWDALKLQPQHDKLLAKKPYLVPQAKGTETHEQFEAMVQEDMNKLIDPGSGYRIRVEVSWDANGDETYLRAPGSQRPDLLLEREVGDGKWEPVHTWDLKTGKAKIERGWANEVNRRLDPVFTPETIKPGFDEDNLKPPVVPR